MVAIIKSSSSLRNILNYNENKLKQNAAKLIHSMNFAKDTAVLNFIDKLKTIEKRIELNQRTRLNAVHISLNFNPSERLKAPELRQISDAYMEKIGFANQPYLVYEHFDSGHPHIHIVTTNIQPDGNRIKMQNIGRNQSEKARQEIEKEFNLVKIESQRLHNNSEVTPLNAQKIRYGKSETRRAIMNVLNVVLPSYKYCSLPELNAILGQYNVFADNGGEHSRIYKNKGLVYRVLDEGGNKVGTPIKASLFYNKPGLVFLEQKFQENKPLKLSHRLRVKNAIDISFKRNNNISLEILFNDLRKEKIHTILRKNECGKIYGITYVDHQSKCVFNGSDLGKQYSANMIQQRCQQPPVQQHKFSDTQTQKIKHLPGPQPITETIYVTENAESLHPTGLQDIAQALMQAEYEGYLPIEFRKKKTQNRKRRRPHH